MSIQLEFNLFDKEPVDHLWDVWAKNEESTQKKFRRLFAENNALKKRLKLIEDYIERENKEKGKICPFDQYDLFTYPREA